MIFLNLEQFNRSVVYKNNSQVLFDNHLYIKGPSFPNHLKAAAIKYSDAPENNNLLTLLVKQQSCLTIWIQQSNLSPTPASNKELKISSSVDPPAANSLKSLYRYRGRTYKIETPVQVADEREKIIYRGQSYQN
jgi:hypothetical protein